MRTRTLARQGLLVPALGLALAVTVTACSSSSSSSSSSSAATSATTSSSAAATPTAASPAASSSSASGGSAATIAAIKKNWVTFFNGKTPAATKINLVQDGQEFASVIKAGASSASSQTASASVQSVTLTSATQAAVTYTILVSGTPMLQGQKGVAVYENGTWKVGLSSFCALMALQSGGKAPTGCSSAS